ncbi:MAG: thioredoxin family protein [Bacillota bacterium]|nr:thioredoxin family protein [Bacillota bacterium]MDP4160441.1 thioredoxin family protein [Bacillota bacterium]
MKKILVLLAVILVALSFGIYYYQAQSGKINAKEVTPEELRQMIEQDNNFFVYYYSPTCPDCVKVEPLVAKAVQLSNIKMVAMNLKEYPDTKAEQQVPGTPTIFFYRNHKVVKGVTGALSSYQEYVNLFKEAISTK